MVNQSVDSIRARIRAIRAMFDLPATAVEREDAGRVRVQVPKLGPDILNRIPK